MQMGGGSSESPQDWGVLGLLEMPLCPSMGARAAPNYAHSPPWVHSMKKLARGKDHPQAGGKSIICAKELWHCIASITGGCKTLQPPMVHGPWSISHSQQVSAHDIPVRILIQTHTLWLRPAAHSNSPWVQTLHGFYEEVYFSQQYYFPQGFA